MFAFPLKILYDALRYLDQPASPLNSNFSMHKLFVHKLVSGNKVVNQANINFMKFAAIEIEHNKIYEKIYEKINEKFTKKILNQKQENSTQRSLRNDKKYFESNQFKTTNIFTQFY